MRQPWGHCGFKVSICLGSYCLRFSPGQPWAAEFSSLIRSFKGSPLVFQRILATQVDSLLQSSARS